MIQLGEKASREILLLIVYNGWFWHHLCSVQKKFIDSTLWNFHRPKFQDEGAYRVQDVKETLFMCKCGGAVGCPELALDQMA